MFYRLQKKIHNVGYHKLLEVIHIVPSANGNNTIGKNENTLPKQNKLPSC